MTSRKQSPANVKKLIRVEAIVESLVDEVTASSCWGGWPESVDTLAKLQDWAAQFRIAFRLPIFFKDTGCSPWDRCPEWDNREFVLDFVPTGPCHLFWRWIEESWCNHRFTVQFRLCCLDRTMPFESDLCEAEVLLALRHNNTLQTTHIYTWKLLLPHRTPLLATDDLFQEPLNPSFDDGDFRETVTSMCKYQQMLPLYPIRAF